MTASIAQSSSARSVRFIAIVLLCASAAAAEERTPSPAQTRTDLLQILDRPRVPLASEVTKLRPRGKLGQEHITFASEAGERVPGVVLTPVASGRHPAVIALHGTGGSKDDLLPLLEQLAGRVFVAVAID
jgi:hypothetical protein